ncbi:MAG TPA: fructose bisphosphate aldolase [Gemmatimonadetes bacterium]|nr:fructose bisphosphate aldolase [Gemmatimonadota bacterium]
MSTFAEQLEKIKTARGFIAALDQSGGSTPRALASYGISEDEWSGQDEMFDAVHEMRTRIITMPAFSGDRVIGAILFEGTMDRDVQGLPTGTYLWAAKQIVPFLKIDKGLAPVENGVQLMRSIPSLELTLERARAMGIFGTKMRSVVKEANTEGIQEIIEQQLEVGKKIVRHGLIPILEPEVDIHCPEKGEVEKILLDSLMVGLDSLVENEKVMLKLTLPEVNGFYAPCIEHPNVLKVVALSGGYSRDEANRRLAHQPKMIASFSRALVEGLSAQQSDEEFNTGLDASIQSIYEASIS